MYIYKKIFTDLMNHRDLIRYLVLSDLKSNTARTYLGFLWWILDPILYMAVFYILVQVILQRGGPDYSAFLFVALIPLKWTISCLVDATTAITSKGRVIQQVYVPKIVFIAVRLLVNSLKFGLGLITLILFLGMYGINFGFEIVNLPIILIIHGLTLLSAMIILAHIGVYFKDIKNIMQYGTRMLFYLSPVLFSIEAIPANIARWLYINPLTTIIVSYRNVLFYNKQPEWIYLFILLIISLLFIYIGLKLLFKFERKYVKVI